MARHKKAQKTRQGARGTTRTAHRQSSRHWPFTSYSYPNRDSNSSGREISAGASSARGSQPATSPRQSQEIKPKSNTAGSDSESVQQSRDQSSNPRGPREAQQTETHTQTEVVASLGPGINPSSQLDPVLERRYLLESFAPHSCISPTTCRQHPVYNSGNISPVPSQRYRITPQCFESYCGPVSLALS